jgi:hypothetical protein
MCKSYFYTHYTSVLSPDTEIFVAAPQNHKVTILVWRSRNLLVETEPEFLFGSGLKKSAREQRSDLEPGLVND